MHCGNRTSSLSPPAIERCNSTWAQPAMSCPQFEYCVEQIIANGIASAGDFSNPKGKPSAKASTKSDDEPAEKPSESDKLVSVSGSGFVVSKNAYIVTNNHVVANCVGDIHGNLAGQAPVNLRVVSADEENDLALLQGPKKFKEKDIATIRASAVNSGDQVVAIGYPLHGLLTSDLTVTTGIISSLAGCITIRASCRSARRFSRATAAVHCTTPAAMLSAW
jgi:S1-C subfamily serine protease